MGPVVVAPGAETPVGPAFDMEGGACTAFVKAFAWSRSSYEKVVAVGEVDEKSLRDLDRDLPKELGFIRSIPLAKRKIWNLGPAAEDGGASDERTDRVTVVAPPV